MREMQRLGLVLAVLIAFLPKLHAQQLERPSTIAVVIAPESFWVKHTLKPVTNAGNRQTSSMAKVLEGKQRNGSNITSEANNRDSIAQEIESGRSVPWSIVFGLTLLTLLPALLLSITPMVRLLVVFHFLRQALGTQTAPSNQVLMGLALMMTWFLMQPVLQKVEQTAMVPYQAGTISGMEAMDRGIVPVKQYMLRYARDKDLEVFAAAGMGLRPSSREDLPIQVVVPAYILSELKAGFQIGAVLFLPFLLVDLVVASVTTSVGMMQLPPVVISTPLKILLFVMVDGWNLLAHQLIKSF
jgi:flagellar biosynthetic protein FliP